MTAGADIGALREQTLDLLAEWTPIASVAGAHAELARMAAALCSHLQRYLGAEIIADGLRATPPIVHARIDRGAARTILVYNMYDVMPADANGWSVDPFVGGITERAGLGACFVGRGAENNKGPLAGMLVAIRALLDADALDANLEILIEGEEESGSTGLQRYLRGPDTPVRRSVAALFPSFCEYGGHAPRIYCGFKGIVYGEIRSSGGAWGGPRAPIHGSNAPWIANPAWRLVQALGTLAGDATGLLSSQALPADRRAMLEQLAAQFDPDAELRFRQSACYAIPGTTFERLEHLLTATTLGLSSLSTRPPDAPGVIPSEARARFELRLAPGIAPAQALDALRARLRDAGMADVGIEAHDGFAGHAFAPDSTGVAALAQAYRRLGAEPQIWPWSIGAAPSHAFAEVAGNFLIGGLGHGGNAHGTDEFVTLAGIDRYLASLLAWLPGIVAEHAGSLPAPASTPP